MLLTDNIGLKYLFDQKTLNERKASWLTILSEYDFEFKHIKGKKNIVADALSRQQHKIYLVLISDYKSEFKTLLKEASNNDEQYKNWVQKCNLKTFGTEEILFHIYT